MNEYIQHKACVYRGDIRKNPYEKIIITGIGNSEIATITTLLSYFNYSLRDIDDWDVIANQPNIPNKTVYKDLNLYTDSQKSFIDTLSSDWLIVVVIRDPLAITQRQMRSGKLIFENVLLKTIKKYNGLMKFIYATEKPIVLISYEQFISHPTLCIRDLSHYIHLDKGSIPKIVSKLFYDKEKSDQLEIFFKKLRRWDKYFDLVQYQEKKGKDKLSSIIRMIQTKDVENLLLVWQEFIHSTYFELPHPEEPYLITRAIFNKQIGMANHVLMLDEEEKKPWIFSQSENFINLIITPTNIYKIDNSNTRSIFSTLRELGSQDVSKISFYDTNFAGFLMGQTRPYHYFYDHLKYFYAVGGKEILKNNQKTLCDGNTYFSPKFDYTSEKFNGVYLFPSVIGNNYLKASESKVIERINFNMENEIFNEAINNSINNTVIKDTLVIWFGITGQKRSWLQQAEGCIEIVTHLLFYFKNIKLIVDGWTAYDGKLETNSEDEQVYEQINLGLKDKCEVMSVIGKDYRSKIRICNQTDVFIVNSGAGAMVPLRFCKKNGVLHYNSLVNPFKWFPDSYGDTIIHTDSNYVKNEQDTVSQRLDHVDYYIDWQYIFNLVAKILNKTKDQNIKYLQVPCMEELV